MPRAVLFDLDGTLLDTLEDIGGAMNAVLERAGFPPHPIEAYKRMVGKGVKHLVSVAAPPGEFSEELLADMRAEYHRRPDRKTKPYPGVAELLDGLASRAVPFAVLSNKPQPLTERAVETFFGKRRFAAVLGARDGIPMKPDPAAANEAAGRLGVPASEVFYLGDTNTDMETAIAAGMIPCAALWGFRDRTELEAAGAKHFLAAPPRLLELL